MASGGSKDDDSAGHSEALRELIRLEQRCAELRGALGLEHRLTPAEEVLSSTEQAAHALVSRFATDFLSVHAADGTYLWASPSCTRLFGWAPSALVGRPAYDLFHPTDLERIAANHAQHVDSASAEAVEYRLRRADGSYCWVETHSTNSKASGGLPQIVCFTRDISARRAERDRVRALLDKNDHDRANSGEDDTQFLRLCAWCKAVGGDEEDWRPLEAFLQEVTRQEVSHGICPGCATELRRRTLEES